MEFVHFTDLHYRSGNAFQQELINQLLSDLKRERAAGLNPDFLVFSGDLVNNPDDKGVWKEFEDEFLAKVSIILGIPSSRIVTCPGNHDISQGIQKAKLRISYEWLQKGKSNQAFLTKEAGSADLLTYANGLSKSLFALSKSNGHEWTNPYANIQSYDDLKVTFVALNSAFGCCLEGSAADRGHLSLPTEMALSAFHMAPKDHLVISLMHHTSGDLTEACCRELVPIIERYASIHCYGHVHQAKPSTIKSTSGECFYLQGGALYETKGFYNGYSIVRIAGKHVEARYRSFWLNRLEFDVGTNVAHGGLVYNSKVAEEFWKNVVPPPSHDDVCLYLMESQTAVCENLEVSLTDRTLSSTFVEPVIVRPAQKEEDTSPQFERQSSIADIINARDHIVIGAGREYGATSLLRRIVMTYFEDCLNMERACVPALIDARRMKAYEANITGLLRAALPDTSSRSLKLQSLHDCGRLVVLIDEFDPGEPGHVAAVKQLRLSFPKARVILTAKLLMLSTDHVLPVVGVEEFVLLQIKPLNRGRIRQLVKRWMPADASPEQTVEEIVTRFRALGIPLTAPYVVIYLSILQDDKGFNPINTSTVIENFVEKVLEKYKPEYKFRSAFDYRDQVDYLGHMAENMARINTYIIDYQTAYDWTRQHFEHIGIDQDFQKIIDFFVLNKVFEVDRNCVLFRYGIFLTFFIASRMRGTRAFRDWILSDSVFMQHVSEIDVYCGLTRNDLEAIDYLGKQFETYANKLADLVKPLAWTEPLEKLKLPKLQDKGTTAETITRQLTTQNVPEAERDRSLDRSDSDKSDVRPLTQRPDVTGILEPWIVSLRAYTVALKNLDAIPASAKERHLSVVLEGWATVLRYACLLFDVLISERQVAIGPIAFRLNLPEHIKTSLLRTLFTHIPVMVSHFLRKDLGSQKLAVQLRAEDPDQTTTIAFLRTGLYADMKLPEYISALKQLREKVRASELFQEAMLLKMHDIYIRFNVSPTEQSAYREIATELSADIKGLQGEPREQHMRKYLGDLKRKELVSKLKDNFAR